MKIKGDANADLSRPKCPIPVTVVGPHGAYNSYSYCKGWNCPICRPKLIKDHNENICNIFIELSCVQVFVAYKKERGKELSNFISRYVGIKCKDYHHKHCRINGIDESVIISDRKFPGSKRIDKRNFLHDILPEILNSPWEKGQRVSFTRGLNKTKKKAKSGEYCRLLGHVSEDYDNLHSDEERAVWIKRQAIFKLHNKGKEFLEKNLPVKVEADDYRSEASTEVRAVC